MRYGGQLAPTSHMWHYGSVCTAARRLHNREVQGAQWPGVAH